MNARFTLLPDPRFESLAGALAERLRAAAALLDWKTLPNVLDPVMRGALEIAFAAAGGDEGTVWLIDEREAALIAAWNSGARASEFVGSWRQPLVQSVGTGTSNAARPGLVSMVLDTQQPLCDNRIHLNDQHDSRLDRHLGLVTTAMIAVPFSFAGELRGVISCVQLRPAASAPAERGFAPEALARIGQAAVLLGRLIDHQLLSVTVGWRSL